MLKEVGLSGASQWHGSINHTTKHSSILLLLFFINDITFSHGTTLILPPKAMLILRGKQTKNGFSNIDPQYRNVAYYLVKHDKTIGCNACVVFGHSLPFSLFGEQCCLLQSNDISE